METYLKALGVDVWLSIVNGYKVPKNAPADPDDNKFSIVIQKLFMPSQVDCQEPSSPR